MTTTITTERTLDELANADRRSIRTRWTTSITKPDRLDGEVTIVLVLETSHHKSRKVVETDLYVEEANGRGFSTRSFTLYDRDPSAGYGVTIHREPVARFNAKVAREQHADALRLLESTRIEGPGRAHRDLAAAWDARI
jgi:hypothetical protein